MKKLVFPLSVCRVSVMIQMKGFFLPWSLNQVYFITNEGRKNHDITDVNFCLAPCVLQRQRHSADGRGLRREADPNVGHRRGEVWVREWRRGRGGGEELKRVQSTHLFIHFFVNVQFLQLDIVNICCKCLHNMNERWCSSHPHPTPFFFNVMYVILLSICGMNIEQQNWFEI